METMDKDEFAKFLFSKGLETKNYNHDVFYDIHQIVKTTRESNIDHKKISEPQKVTCYWYFKNDTGTWLFMDEPNNTAEANSQETYKFTFTINHAYLHNIPYAIIEKLR